MNDTQQALNTFLQQRPWRRSAFQEICDTPKGLLISYGRIADLLDEKYNLKISPRTIGWFRHKLYSILGHDTKVPLHRVATNGDIHSLNDSKETKEINDQLRQAEGSIQNPKWR